MSAFVCAINYDGRTLSHDERHIVALRHSRIAAGKGTWMTGGGFAAYIDSHNEATPRVSTVGSDDAVSVGMARLDAPSLVDIDSGHEKGERDMMCAAQSLLNGAAAMRAITGDFAIVTWRPGRQEVVAARDCFGVAPLYYRTTTNGIWLSTHASLIAADDEVDYEYIADFLVHGCVTSERTIYRGVSAVPAGAMLVASARGIRIEYFWRARDLVWSGTDCLSAEMAAEQLRLLLDEAVGARIEGQGRTWAQLSGGLDSSSIVAAAERLHRAGRASSGLAGTVTIVDSLGSGDESDFVREVLRMYEIPNARIADYWPWREDATRLPITDQPRLMYPYYARDQEMCRIVRESGGRVLLSGYGSDHYLTGNLGFITDLIAGGRILRAIDAMARRATTTHTSFWRLAYACAIQPLLPQVLRRKLIPPRRGLPAWLEPRFEKQYAIADRRSRLRRYEECADGYGNGELAWQIEALPSFIEREPFEHYVDLRYPFLYRPLVEFCLGLNPEFIAQPGVTKLVLRQALGSELPDRVRNRVGKGTLGARTRWALTAERSKLKAMLKDPVLAQLGCIQRDKLRGAMSLVRRGRGTSVIRLYAALSLETWLQVRSGLWPPRAATPQAA